MTCVAASIACSETCSAPVRGTGRGHRAIVGLPVCRGRECADRDQYDHDEVYLSSGEAQGLMDGCSWCRQCGWGFLRTIVIVPHIRCRKYFFAHDPPCHSSSPDVTIPGTMMTGCFGVNPFAAPSSPGLSRLPYILVVFCGVKSMSCCSWSSSEVLCGARYRYIV